jgi:hypothetical protein
VVESVLPCGMPCVMVWCLECAKGVCVVWVRSVKYDWNNVSVAGSKL